MQNLQGCMLSSKHSLRLFSISTPTGKYVNVANDNNILQFFLASSLSFVFPNEGKPSFAIIILLFYGQLSDKFSLLACHFPLTSNMSKSSSDISHRHFKRPCSCLFVDSLTYICFPLTCKTTSKLQVYASGLPSCWA